MKKLLLSALSLLGAYTLQAQYYYPTGNTDAPTWYYEQVINNGGDFTNNKTGRSGDALYDAYLDFTTSSSGDAYDGAFEFFVNTGDSVYTEAGTVDTTVSIFTLGEQLIDGLYVSKSYYFSTAEPVVRATFKIRNPTGTAKSTKIGIFTNFGSDDGTQLDSSSTDGATLTDSDRWFISSDGENGDRDPINTFVRFGPGTIGASAVSGLIPVIDNDGDDFLDTFAITVPANSYSLILQFNRMDTTVAAAKANVSKFNSAASLSNAGYLIGLSTADLGKVVNWNLAGVVAGVQEVTDASQQVALYPVPTSQLVNVSLGNVFEGKTTIRIQDITGVTFMTREISKSSGTHSESFDVSALEPGMYLVEIKNNEKVAYKKLIKN